MAILSGDPNQVKKALTLNLGAATVGIRDN
jgi:hypothetical protein